MLLIEKTHKGLIIPKCNLYFKISLRIYIPCIYFDLTLLRLKINNVPSVSQIMKVIRVLNRCLLLPKSL